MRLLERVVLGVAATAVVCSSVALRTRAGDEKDAAQVFLKAAELSDIRSPGSPPFELDAKVNIWSFDGTPIPGSYQLLWVSPSRWREELSFSGYSRVRVGGEERYWQQRSLDYEPQQISELGNAVNFVGSLRGEKSPRALKSRKESGVKLDCTRSSEASRKEYCFDPSEGVLVLERIPGPGRTAQSSFRYSNFQTFGEKHFPGTIQVEVEQKPIADFTILRLANTEEAAASKFDPPNGATVWLTCSTGQESRLVNKMTPIYPMEERRAYRQGVVVMYALIASDGTVQNLRVLAAPSPGLADAAIAAVRQWRYEPKRCGDTPTAEETSISVLFSLGRP